jgi:crotonobetainyl-CoA:carnitine CoA-transferase CaiB-like acyl-CoA transferase
MVREVDHPRLGRIKTLGPPAKFSATPLELRLPAPSIGQHTADVLDEIGYARAEIDQLFEAGTVYRATSPEPTSEASA